MDPIKVAGVADWKTLKNVRDIRKFLGFVNFYRRFIPNHSKKAKPMNDLLKKGVPFEWKQEQEDAFQELKQVVQKEPVLLQPDQKKPFEVEIDASNYTIGAVLMQKDDKGILHPVAYFSKSLNSAQRNYDVYNRELLGLVETCRHFRQYLHQPAHTVKIHTDHANLLYWKNPGEHNRRVARWHAELMEYDFQLVHIPGKKNGRTDALSRCPDHDTGEEDNKKLVVLPKQLFAKAHARLAGSEEADPSKPQEWARMTGLSNEKHQSTQDLVIMHQKTKEGKMQLKKWSNTYQFTQKDGVTYKHNQTVVSRGNDLKRGVIHFYHETPSAGHPGIGNTYKLMKRDFWWPSMKQDAEQYVKGCAACQANKINTHPLKPTIFPIAPVNGLPFQTIAMDFITKLPKSGKYDTILTIMDHDCSKAAIFIPCQETITAEGVAALYIRHVYPRYGIPAKVITDRDTRFTLKFAKGLCKALRIKQNISMAYHPQTDGQSERTNQFLETYLRFYCEEKQDDWHQWLPFAEFAHNQMPNVTTRKTPFDLIMGYTPRIEWNASPLEVPAVEERLGKLEDNRVEAFMNILKAQRVLRMKRKGSERFKPYKENDQVWIEGTNLQILYPSKKLGPKCYGPFKILKQLSDAVYQVEIPKHWKIHNVFHANLITPYKETELHRPNYTRPPPDLVDGEEEFEVEKIINMKQMGRGRKTYYLVKWKGYPMSDNSWEPWENIHADELIKEFQSRAQKTNKDKGRRKIKG